MGFGNMIRFGVHCSLRNGLCGALEEAHSLGCEAVQMFTRSPRMWKMRMPTQQEAADFRELRHRLGIHPLVVHTPYLPNLATVLPDLYTLSCAALEDDLAVSRMIEADFLVIHPGSYSPESTMKEGIRRITEGINTILNKIPGKTMILLENVAGGGRRIGSSFEQLAELLLSIEQKHRMGICFDTAHATGAGYDLSTKNGVMIRCGILKRLSALIILK
jgi:deoxyribonuclease-4